MNYNKLLIFSRLIFRNFTKIHINNNIKKCEICLLSSKNVYNKSHKYILVPVLSLGLSFFKKEDEETPEQKLIMTIKRSILFIQREQPDKAEQMLHLALRMAQDMQNKDGITYIYDVMANLAMEVNNYDKAEKIFTNVMRRLMADGFGEDDIKILHISSKIAHMADLQGNLEKALIGFNWTITKLEEKIKTFPDDPELKELWALTKNWYGQLLMKVNEFTKAKDCFLDAYEVFIKYNGKIHEEAIMILNSLSVASSNLGDTENAKKYLEEGITIAKQFPDMVEVGILKANLGLLYLKEGLVNQGKELCKLAWHLGKKKQHEDTIEQAEYCFEQIKLAQK